MAEAATYFRYGSTRAVIELVEREFLTNLPWGNQHPYDAISALHHYAVDPTLHAVAPFGRGYYSAADVQEFYYGQVARFSESAGRMNEERKRLLTLWHDLIARARAPHPERELSPFVDWAAKMRLLQERGLWYERSRGRGVSFPDAITRYRAQALDIHYHDVSHRGLANILMSSTRDQRLWHLERMVPDSSITRAVREPASGDSATRAYARARQIAWIKEHLRPSCPVNINWERITIHQSNLSGPFYTFSNPDPRRSNPHLPPRTEHWPNHALITRRS